MLLYGAETWYNQSHREEGWWSWVDQWCFKYILNIACSEHITILKSAGVLDSHFYQILCWPDALSCLVMWHGRTSPRIIPVLSDSKELEAASRSSKASLTENGGVRPAPNQPRSCVSVSECAGQNSLASTRRNGYVTDNPDWLHDDNEMKRNLSLLNIVITGLLHSFSSNFYVRQLCWST